MEFYAPVCLDTEDKNLRTFLTDCCRAMRHMGTSRNRGLGNVKVSLCEISEKHPKGAGKTAECLPRSGCVKISYSITLDAPLTLPGHDELNTSVPARSVIGCMADGRLVGVAIVGRPVSRYLDNGLTLEVNRLCTDGTKNACSFLYAAAWRAARAMGYRKIVTYILDTESGASLRAAGWKCAGLAGGKRWTGSRRPAADLYPAQMKYRYEQSIDERSF